MKALVVEGPKNAVFKEINTPVPDKNQLLIKVLRVGICATDNAIYTGECSFVRDGSITYPCRFGHEWSGVVETVGSEVKNFKKGDRVICDNAVSCGNCDACKDGRYAECPSIHSVGTVNCWDGCFAEYMLMPEYHVYHIADSLSFEVAALNEPLSIAYEAFKRTKLDKNSFVAVTGTGPIGIAAVALAKYFGAGRVAMVGRRQHKLEIAKAVGATDLINNTEISMPEQIKKLTNGAGADLIIETSGAQECLFDAVWSAKKYGTIEAISFYEKDLTGFPIDHLVVESITLHGAAGCFGNAKAVIDILENDDLGLQKLITHKVKFDDCLEFFKNADKYHNEKIKVMVEFD